MQIDHVHFYVEDARKWRDWFVNSLGFQGLTSSIFPCFSARGKLPDTCTEVVQNGAVRFLLSSPVLSTSPVAEFLTKHPPGVADVAFAVENITSAIALAETNGGKILQPIEDIGFCKYAQVAAWGSLTHTLIERPVSKQLELTIDHDFDDDFDFTYIDHLVLNVAIGDLEPAISWYEKTFNFQPQQAFKIKTDYSGLSSQVMVSPNGHIQLPINEPTSPNSQIQEFLDVNQGSGIQHIALVTNNLISAIAKFRAAGLSFLSVPQSYYLYLPQEIKFLLSPTEFEAIATQEILVDWQKEAHSEALLLQIFTQPIFGQPTFFLEFIERRCGATGFGEGNFRALFTAMEMEQMRRSRV